MKLATAAAALVFPLVLLLAAGWAEAQTQRQFQIERSVRCTAHPGSGKAGCECKGAEKTYTGPAAGKAKDSIIQACIQANRPDRCNCIQQCRQVARCK
jgi:hypothetical protein